MSADVTIVICARNAASTIARAIRSAFAQRGAVVLVDDWSEDGTAEAARMSVGEELRIVRPPAHRTLGFARHHGVHAVETEWLMWLDADDELLPGRADRLAAVARRESRDAVWDAAELWDGPGDRLIRPLPMPALMLRDGAGVRLFERNHLPGLAWPLVRTSFAQQIGYDADLPTADDLDFSLRALRAGGRLGFVSECGYRQFAYPPSLSRDLEHQRRWVARVLKRHEYDDVQRLYLEAGYPPRLTAWALVSMALFRGEPEMALRFLDQASPVDGDPDLMIEEAGPWPFREGWRRTFQFGTCLLLCRKDREAELMLRDAEEMEPTAEGANNLGVALARQGNIAGALEWWEKAERRFPGFLDARLNRDDPGAHRITTHPLRRQPSRSEY